MFPMCSDPQKLDRSLLEFSVPIDPPMDESSVAGHVLRTRAPLEIKNNTLSDNTEMEKT